MRGRRVKACGYNVANAPSDQSAELFCSSSFKTPMHGRFR
jgi:hypothetical protein